MHIEAFSEAREPARPETNEDAFVVLPGRAYAVIDGVTDRNGTRYDGMLAGRYAARLVASALERRLPSAISEVVPTLTRGLRDAYHRHGIDLDPTNWGARMCCTLALAMQSGDFLDVLLVGDSGIRLNGTNVLQMHKDLDLITALLRQSAWHRIIVAVSDPIARETLSRRVAFHGVHQDAANFDPPLDLAAIGAEAAAACRAALPNVPGADIDFLLHHGIVDGQGIFQNRTDSVLGYACLDGLPVPDGLIRIERFAMSDIQRIELFTDGYARPAADFGIAAWEVDFAATEREDPHKTGRFLSVKGSIPGRWSDDRTYLGVQFDTDKVRDRASRHRG